jgi:hypothetical protein
MSEMTDARAALQAAAPQGVRVSLDDSFPGKGWLLEVHGDDELDDDAAQDALVAWVDRFHDLGRALLGDPAVRAGYDLRVRMQGKTSHWCVFEYSSMSEADMAAGVRRLAAALAP